MTPIPTANNPTAVRLSTGAVVYVKRLRKISKLTKIAEAARVREGDTASQMRNAALLLRCGIVGAEGLVDPETGNPQEFTTDQHPTLGRIASEDVADCVCDTDDIVLVVSRITGRPVEDIAGDLGADTAKAAASELTPEHAGN